MFDPRSLWKQKRIENKQKLAEYRRRYWQGLVTDEARPLGTGDLNRDGMPRVPPGQHEAKGWPVLDLGVHPKIGLDEWRLEVSGLVTRPTVLDWRRFMAVPQLEDVSDFHCVTSWSRFGIRWTGVRFSDLMEAVGLEPAASHVLIHAYDGYTTNLELADAMKYDVLIVHSADGQPLPIEHGGPARMITPQKYAWKGAKWIKGIELLDHDVKGFWEERGYSNTAEPWLNDRYSDD